MDDKRNGTGVKTSSLTPELIAQVMDSLAEVGDYGEVHLIVVKGQIRYVRTLKSVDAAHDPRD